MIAAVIPYMQDANFVHTEVSWRLNEDSVKNPKRVDGVVVLDRNLLIFELKCWTSSKPKSFNGIEVALDQIKDNGYVSIATSYCKRKSLAFDTVHTVCVYLGPVEVTGDKKRLLQMLVSRPTATGLETVFDSRVL